MSPKSIDVYQQAHNHLLAHEYEEALAGFLAVSQVNPQHLWSRFEIGNTLEKMNDIGRAFEVFKALAWHCTKSGFPMLGIVATKRAAHLQGGFEDTLDILSELYSLESDRIDQTMPPQDLFELNPEAEANVIDSADDKLPVLAVQHARNFPEFGHPGRLPAIPLFSLLTAEAFYPILDMLELRQVAPGEIIVKQGDPCSSIYLLAHGEVEVAETRNETQRTLARLGSQSVFGEMALITDAPRLASAVAVRQSEVLELRREDLEAAAEDLDDITWAMAKFTRQRFLNHVLLTSPIFAPFNQDDKKDILERFTSVGVPTDEVIIKEGEPGNGLYIILGGEVEVSKFESGDHIHLARLAEGSVFGEISLVNDSPTTATVQATRGGEFLFLSRSDFQELVAQRPEIRSSLTELSEDRLQHQRDAILDAGANNADGMVIF